MYREINRKRIILERRKPFDKAAAEEIEKLDRTDLICAAFRLDGGRMTREVAWDILNGNMHPEVALGDYMKIQRYGELVQEIDAYALMQSELNAPLIADLYEKLFGEKPEKRRTNGVMYEWDYVMPHPEETEAMLAELINWIGLDGRGANRLETPELKEEPSDFVRRAAYIHLRFVEICPFAENNAETARLIMHYYLRYKGYPLFALSFSEREYNEAISEYLAHGNAEPFISGVGRSLYNKMDILTAITNME